jgi:transcriptional regulator with XRE-family HTH domain
MTNSARIAELEAEVKRLRKLGRTKREPVAGIGGIIQMQRETRNLGLKELSARSGIAAGLLSNMESGRLLNPTWNTIKSLAKGFGIKPSQLVEGFEAQEADQ